MAQLRDRQTELYIFFKIIITVMIIMIESQHMFYAMLLAGTFQGHIHPGVCEPAIEDREKIERSGKEGHYTYT